MNPVYIRMACYILFPALAAAGFGTFDAEAGTLTIGVDQAALAMATAAGLSAAVFGAWGKK